MVEIAGEAVPAGRLWSHRRRGSESATFTYLPEYLARPDAYALDPELELDASPKQTEPNLRMFRAFSDCAPDGWGRRLIRRSEARRATSGQRAERSIGEIDFLLGARDDMRHGALRFREPGGEFLAPEESGVPPLVELSRLLGAAERLDRDMASDEDLRTLLRGGSSLGGARPKAHVLLGSGEPAIAKFPSPASDGWDVIRWEAVALELASNAGISVPPFALHVVDGKPVLVVRRFDRERGTRIGFVSAMTMLEATDGDLGSYLEIAEVIEERSDRVVRDLAELWRRIVFSVLISNTDDHLRNHGFLRTTTSGWSLSPAFDLNPVPGAAPKYLSTAIDGSPEARLDVALDVADLFRLDRDGALAVLGEVVAAVSGWERVAAERGLSDGEVEMMASAFRHDQSELAGSLTCS